MSTVLPKINVDLKEAALKSSDFSRDIDFDIDIVIEKYPKFLVLNKKYPN